MAVPELNAKAGENRWGTGLFRRPAPAISRIEVVGWLAILLGCAYGAYDFAQARMADGWLSANVLFEAEVRSVSTGTFPSVVVTHEGRPLTVRIASADQHRLRPGQRLCVTHVPATGYAGRCRDGRLDDDLRNGAAYLLGFAVLGVTWMVLIAVLRLTGRIGHEPSNL